MGSLFNNKLNNYCWSKEIIGFYATSQCLGLLLDYTEFVLYAMFMFGSGVLRFLDTYKYYLPHICIYNNNIFFSKK